MSDDIHRAVSESLIPGEKSKFAIHANRSLIRGAIFRSIKEQGPKKAGDEVLEVLGVLIMSGCDQAVQDLLEIVVRMAATMEAMDKNKGKDLLTAIDPGQKFLNFTGGNPQRQRTGQLPRPIRVPRVFRG